MFHLNSQINAVFILQTLYLVFIWDLEKLTRKSRSINKIDRKNVIFSFFFWFLPYCPILKSIVWKQKHFRRPFFCITTFRDCIPALHKPVLPDVVHVQQWLCSTRKQLLVGCHEWVAYKALHQTHSSAEDTHRSLISFKEQLFCFPRLKAQITLYGKQMAGTVLSNSTLTSFRTTWGLEIWERISAFSAVRPVMKFNSSELPVYFLLFLLCFITYLI